MERAPCKARCCAVAGKPAAGSAGGHKTADAPAHRLKTGAAAVRPASSSDRAQALFSSHPLGTVMPVSFPEFFSISGTKAQVQAIVPLPTVLADLGLTASAVDSVQISIPEAESYGLPVAALVSELQNWSKSNGGDDGIVSGIQRVLAPLRGGEASAYCPLGAPQLFVVNEIYATRSIDVSMSFASSSGVRGGAGINLPAGGKKAAVWDALSKYIVPQTPPASGGASGGTSEADKGNSNHHNDKTATAPPEEKALTIDQATAFVKELDALYSKLGGDQPLTYPGGQVTVVTANSAGVNMNRKFEIPVVIGYRGFAMDLDTFDFVQKLPKQGAKSGEASAIHVGNHAYAPLSNPIHWYQQ